jgi:hypothetical protein
MATHACVPKRLLAAGRHSGVKARTMKIPLNPPFSKGDDYSSLWQREVGRDLEGYFIGNTNSVNGKDPKNFNHRRRPIHMQNV